LNAKETGEGWDKNPTTCGMRRNGRVTQYSHSYDGEFSHLRAGVSRQQRGRRDGVPPKGNITLGVPASACAEIFCVRIRMVIVSGRGGSRQAASEIKNLNQRRRSGWFLV